MSEQTKFPLVVLLGLALSQVVSVWLLDIEPAQAFERTWFQFVAICAYWFVLNLRAKATP